MPSHKANAFTCAADALCTVWKARFPRATPQLGGIPHCLPGTIWNQAVCFLGPFVFQQKHSRHGGKQSTLRGQQFRPSRADTGHPASWIPAAAKPHPWRRIGGLSELSRLSFYTTAVLHEWVELVLYTL